MAGIPMEAQYELQKRAVKTTCKTNMMTAKRARGFNIGDARDRRKWKFLRTDDSMCKTG